ncbi:hypothetical protein nbrc107696_01820 [Gordonia spumicola]|uniref:Uncharacterized protein n=1 Tax=Gordonia spumicola TaxID=589161 RepID=A0A7I9V2V3_9ACTN|nr:hypothetical protein [Gordonia spumicola]GED99735.1 hypothetical protein nbrc107696_01820 [Gordonia spumicola]
MTGRVPTIEPDSIDEHRVRAYFGDCVEVEVATGLILTNWGEALPVDHAEDVSWDLQRAIAFVQREARRGEAAASDG